MRWKFLILGIIFFTFARASSYYGSVDTDAEASSDSDEKLTSELLEYFYQTSDIGSPVTQTSETNDESSGSECDVQLPRYPPVRPYFDPRYNAIFDSVLDQIPHFRTIDVFKVTSMQDLRYIRIVFEPSLGPLSRVFRFEYDWNAIEADCKSEQDFLEFRYFYETYLRE